MVYPELEIFLYRRGEVEYATDLYDEATVRRFIGYLTRILRQLT